MFWIALQKDIEAQKETWRHDDNHERPCSIKGNTARSIKGQHDGSHHGLPIVLGNDRSPHETFMQVPGEGLRISANKLREAISQSPSVQRALLGFAHAFMNQTANTALSNGTAAGGTLGTMAAHGARPPPAVMRYLSPMSSYHDAGSSAGGCH